MYTPIETSISYGSKLGIGLNFDVNSLQKLVSISIKNVNRSITDFKRNKGRIHKDQLMDEIGISMEIINAAIFSNMVEKEIKLGYDKERDINIKKEIKKLFIKVEKTIYKLGDFDSDFITMSSTQRARPSKEVMDYIIKQKW